MYLAPADHPPVAGFGEMASFVPFEGASQVRVATTSTTTGADLTNLDFYVVLSFFKLAVILEGIHARYLEGGTVGAGFEAIGQQALGLARTGLAVADRSAIAGLNG